MTPQEVIAEMNSDSLLNRVRRIVSDHYAQVEAESRSRRPPSGIEYRRKEFDTARALIALIKAEDNDDRLFKEMPVVRS